MHIEILVDIPLSEQRRRDNGRVSVQQTPEYICLSLSRKAGEQQGILENMYYILYVCNFPSQVEKKHFL